MQIHAPITVFPKTHIPFIEVYNMLSYHYYIVAVACTGGGSSTLLSLASAPPYIILVSAFYLLSSLMTYTLSKTVLVIFQISQYIKLSEFGRNHGCCKANFFFGPTFDFDNRRR